MRFLWLGLALWNTIVAAINIAVLPLFVTPDAMVYVTQTSQLLPVAIPLVLYAFIYYLDTNSLKLFKLVKLVKLALAKR